jgi:hypothetical protein
VAGWGDDPELERLRQLIDDGWEVVDVTEDSSSGAPMDTVRLRKGGEETECASDHLAFHRYVEGLQEEQPPQ